MNTYKITTIGKANTTIEPSQRTYNNVLLAVSPFDTGLPGGRGKGVVFPPVQIGAVGTYVRDKGQYNIDIQAMNAWNWDEVKDFLEETKPQVVGMSVYTYNYADSIKLANLIKYLLPETIVCLGGHHIYEATDTLILENHQSVDFVVTGEGEYTLLEALNRLNESKDLHGVTGVTYRNNEGEIIRNRPREFESDIDNFPDIDWTMMDCTLVPRTTNMYSEISYFKKLRGSPDMGLVPILISRGCPAKCTFCSAGRVYGKWRMRNVERILDEIEYLYTEFGFRYFEMQSPTFPQWAKMDKQLLQGIIDRKLNIRWYGMTRGNKFDDELIRLVKESGCEFLLCGLETGSEELNLKQKKYRKIHRAREVVTSLANAGVPVMASFLHNYPDSGRKEDIDTMRFIKDLSQHGVLSSTNRLWIEPNSDLYDMAVERNILHGAHYWETPLKQSPRYNQATEKELQTHILFQLNFRLFFHINAYGNFFDNQDINIFEPSDLYHCWALINMAFYGLEKEHFVVTTSEEIQQGLRDLITTDEWDAIEFLTLNQEKVLKFSSDMIILLDKSHAISMDKSYYDTGWSKRLTIDFAGYPVGDTEATMRDFENEDLLSLDLRSMNESLGLPDVKNVLVVMYSTETSGLEFEKLEESFPSCCIQILCHSNDVPFVKQVLDRREQVAYIFDKSNSISHLPIPKKELEELSSLAPDLIVILGKPENLLAYRSPFSFGHEIWPDAPIVGLVGNKAFVVKYPKVLDSWYQWKLKGSEGIDRARLIDQQAALDKESDQEIYTEASEAYTVRGAVMSEQSGPFRTTD